MSQGLTIVAKSHVWREKSQKATFVVRLSGCHRVFYIKDQLAAPSTCFPFKSISSYFSCTSWHKCSALLEKKRDDQRYVTYADAVVISLHLLHRAINTRKVCNDTQTHAQTRARNFRIINHWWFRNDLHLPHQTSGQMIEVLTIYNVDSGHTQEFDQSEKQQQQQPTVPHHRSPWTPPPKVPVLESPGNRVA